MDSVQLVALASANQTGAAPFCVNGPHFFFVGFQLFFW